MAGNIKGITIELNGDTTKLDKALREVNKETRTVHRLDFYRFPHRLSSVCKHYGQRSDRFHHRRYSGECSSAYAVLHTVLRMPFDLRYCCFPHRPYSHHQLKGGSIVL